MTAIQADLRCSGEGLHFIRLVVSPVVGDRLVALEEQVRNLQVQVNSLRVSQPATASETAPDTRAQDERVLLEIQQLRSTVALLCDELKRGLRGLPSSPTPIPVEESSHGKRNKPRKKDGAGVLDAPGSVSISDGCGSPPHPADPEQQQQQQQQQRERVVDGETRPEDKSSVSRPARSSITSLPSRRPSSDVKEGYRRSSASVHLSPSGSIERRGSLAHQLSSPPPGEGIQTLRESGEPSMGYVCCWTIVSEDLCIIIISKGAFPPPRYARINAQYGSLGACVEALCTGEGTFDTSTRFECLDFAAIIEQVGMTPKEGCRLFRILDTQRVGLVSLEHLALAAAGKLPRRRSSVGLSRSPPSRRGSTHSPPPTTTAVVAQQRTAAVTMERKAFALPPIARPAQCCALSEDNQFCCTLCNKKSYGFSIIIESHCASDKHKRNVEWAARTNPPPTDRQTPHRRAYDMNGTMFNCPLCVKQCYDIGEARVHCDSKAHVKAVIWKNSDNTERTDKPDYDAAYNKQFYRVEDGQRVATVAGVIGSDEDSAPCNYPNEQVNNGYLICEVCDVTPQSWSQWKIHLHFKKHLSRRAALDEEYVCYWQKLHAGGVAYYYEHISQIWQWGEVADECEIKFRLIWEHGMSASSGEGRVSPPCIMCMLRAGQAVLLMSGKEFPAWACQQCHQLLRRCSKGANRSVKDRAEARH
ncbi:hypothetical protein FOL46_009499, partial [Perkinsus olseni]